MDASDPPFNWRSNLKVHPAADLFPLMSESELKELADDIGKNGLQGFIAFRSQNGLDELIDGRNRLDALALLGWLGAKSKNPIARAPLMIRDKRDGQNVSATHRFVCCHLHRDIDVQSYVISANVHRRHLTADQKRDLIAKLLKAQPESSDRAIAKSVKVDNKTVAAVRSEMERREEIPHVEKRADTKGRKQPSKKPGRTDTITPVHEPNNAAEASVEKRKAYYDSTEQSDGENSPTQPTQDQPVDLRINVSLEQWKNLSTDERNSLLSTSRSDLKHVPSFNRQESDAIEWAQWSWNPVTGCKHTCPYCYARDIASLARMAKAYPHGFAPAFRPAALLAPRQKKPPQEAESDTRYRNVFTCSMADLFGGWMPKEWIEAVLNEIRNAPEWNFLCLTKFPKRIAEFDIPPNAWMGTTVDLQARVANAEAAFAKIKSGVRWLSIEPMLEPLKFKNLGNFDWIVIGGASSSSKTPEWYPPFEWVSDLVAQARAIGTKVYFKTNLGIKKRILELPFDAPIPQENGPAPAVFHYLGGQPRAEAAA